MNKPIVNVINLPHRKDRLEQFDKQAKEQGFEYKVWEGIVIEQMVFAGISRGHKSIIQYAKDNNMESIICCEDDCCFSHPNSFSYFLENKPKSYDIYFGGVYRSNIKDGRIIFGFSGLTFYRVHNRFYNEFLQMKEANHLDRELGRFSHKYEYKVCNPMVCYQSAGYSDNRKQEESYEHLLDGVELYKG